MSRARPKIDENQRKLYKKARKQGWRIESTRGGHSVWISPEGQKVYNASSASDWRGVKNFTAQLRRKGLRL